MALTRPELQVTWPTAANSKSVAFGAEEVSEVLGIDVTTVNARIHLEAVNAGTPAAGDSVNFYLQETGGNRAGAGADEYDTDGHRTLLARLDVSTAALDPARKSVQLPLPQKDAQLVAVSNAASNSITVAADITEQRAA